MDKVSEDVQTLTYLIQSLGNQLNESNNQINTLKSAAQKLVSKEDYEKFTSIEPRPDVDSTEAEEEYRIIQELETEKLGHIMDLQKQDYISEKLLELIEQNKGIIESVREFFQHKQEIRSDDQAISDSRIENFKNVIIQPNIIKIDMNTAELQRKMRILEHNFTKIQTEIEKDSELLLSTKYQEEVKELTETLNGLFQEYISSAPDAKV